MKVPAYQLALQAQQAHQADPAARFVLLRLAADAEVLSRWSEIAQAPLEADEDEGW